MASNLCSLAFNGISNYANDLVDSFHNISIGHEKILATISRAKVFLERKKGSRLGTFETT